jgi:uncharacterized protein (TIGR00251 family)
MAGAMDERCGQHGSAPDSGPIGSMRINIRVKPNSREESISLDKGIVLVSVKKKPEKGAANSAVLKLLKKELGMQARLVRGIASRNKTVEILGDENEIRQRLASLMDSAKQKGD